MAKDKSKSGLKNKHLHARIAYLHCAAVHLTRDHGTVSTMDQDRNIGSKECEQPPEASLAQEHTDSQSQQTTRFDPHPSGGLPIYLSAHLSQVARKSQIRLRSEVKHSICKRCGAIQVEGTTCKKFTENLSKGRKKQHATVLVQECKSCGVRKRWPVGATRQRKKRQRMNAEAESEGQIQAGATQLEHLQPPEDIS